MQRVRPSGLGEEVAMVTVFGDGGIPTVKSNDGGLVLRTVTAQIQRRWSFPSLLAPPLD